MAWIDWSWTPTARLLRPVAVCAAMAFAPALQAAEPPNTAIDRLDQPALTLNDPTKAELQVVKRLGDRLIAVGQRGVALFSDDEGKTWIQAPTPVSVALTSLAVRSDGLAIAVGHDSAILRSTDRGSSWTRVTDGRDLLPQIVEVAKAEFDEGKARLDAATEEERGDLEFEVDDLQFRWETALTGVEFGPSWPFLHVIFLSDRPDEQRLIAMGAFGMAFLSEDAGESWTLIRNNFDNPTDFHLNFGHVTESGAILIGSEAGLMFRSDDGGASFTPIETFDGFSFFGLKQLPGTDQIIAYGFGDTYHFSTDEGVTWSSAPLSESLTLAGSVELPSGGIGVMGDGGQMIEIGADGEKRRFRPIDTRKFLGDAVPLSGSKVLFVGEIGVRIADL